MELDCGAFLMMHVMMRVLSRLFCVKLVLADDLKIRHHTCCVMF